MVFGVVLSTAAEWSLEVVFEPLVSGAVVFSTVGRWSYMVSENGLLSRWSLEPWCVKPSAMIGENFLCETFRRYM